MKNDALIIQIKTLCHIWKLKKETMKNRIVNSVEYIVIQLSTFHLKCHNWHRCHENHLLLSELRSEQFSSLNNFHIFVRFGPGHTFSAILNNPSFEFVFLCSETTFSSNDVFKQDTAQGGLHLDKICKISQRIFYEGVLRSIFN